MAILFAPLLLARLIYSGWLDGRVESCWCEGKDRGGLVAKGEFLADVDEVDPIDLRFDLGQWIGPGREGEADVPAMLRALAAQGYDALTLGRWEAARHPDQVRGWLALQPLPAVLTGVDYEGVVADHLLIPWEGQVVLLLAVVDPLDADPLWGLPEPAAAIEGALAATAGLYDQVILVSWLDTFRNRDLAAAWPGEITVVVEALYDFAGIDTPGHEFGLVGLDRCGRLQVLARDFPDAALEGAPARWARRLVEIGDGYEPTRPDLRLWPAPGVAPDPPVSSRVCVACHADQGEGHGHPPPFVAAAGGCRACHAGGWGHLMAAASAVPMPTRPVSCGACHEGLKTEEEEP